MKRSLPSAINQTYENLDILVVGDGTEQDTVDAMAKVTDPRVRFVNLPHYPDYPPDPKAYWAVGGVPPLNWGLDNAKGEWVTMVGDDDALMLHHVKELLIAAIEQDVDYIYGRSAVYGAGNTATDEVCYGVLGSWPPAVASMGNGLWKSSIKHRYDVNAWMKGLPCDWEFVTRLLEDGVKFGWYPKATYKYYPNHGIPRIDPTYISDVLGILEEKK